jgi:hypothetical protein
VAIQNAVVRDVYSQEASYRSHQNWLENYAACTAFGFVYLHPFMDGDGRLHRFVIHHVLAHSGLVAPEMVIPVSAVIMKHIPAYHQVLNEFSGPVTRLWDYLRHDDGPQILNDPGCGPYRYFQADREVAFLSHMLREAVEQEIALVQSFLQSEKKPASAGF